MIPSLLLLWIIMGILFLIGIFSPRTRRLALKIKIFIFQQFVRLLKLLSPGLRQMIFGLVIVILLLTWCLKQRFS